MKISNKETTSEELVFDREYTLEDYAEAHRHAVYSPDSGVMLFELRMAVMFVFLKL
jgi:hypothetical protein